MIFCLQRIEYLVSVTAHGPVEPRLSDHRMSADHLITTLYWFLHTLTFLQTFCIFAYLPKTYYTYSHVNWYYTTQIIWLLPYTDFCTPWSFCRFSNICIFAQHICTRPFCMNTGRLITTSNWFLNIQLFCTIAFFAHLPSSWIPHEKLKTRLLWKVREPLFGKGFLMTAPNCHLA